MPEPSDGTVNFGNNQLTAFALRHPDYLSIPEVSHSPSTRFRLLSIFCFSTPQTQFPILLAPGERRPLIVCYSPVRVKAAPDYDTLRFGLRCLSRDFPLRGTAETILRDGSTRCEISLVSRSITAPTSFFFDQTYPNPVASGRPVALKFGIPETTDAELALYDLQGVRRAQLLSGSIAGSILPPALKPTGCRRVSTVASSAQAAAF